MIFIHSIFEKLDFGLFLDNFQEKGFRRHK